MALKDITLGEFSVTVNFFQTIQNLYKILKIKIENVFFNIVVEPNVYWYFESIYL